MAISIQQRLIPTDQSKKEGRAFEPLRPTNGAEFIALSKNEEYLNRAAKVIAAAEKWWPEPDPEARKQYHEKLQQLKRSLLEIYVFQGTAEDEHRQQASIILNGQYSADFDDIADPEALLRQWQDLWPVIDPNKHPLSRMAEELGLTYIGLSISELPTFRRISVSSVIPFLRLDGITT